MMSLGLAAEAGYNFCSVRVTELSGFGRYYLSSMCDGVAIIDSKEVQNDWKEFSKAVGDLTGSGLKIQTCGVPESSNHLPYCFLSR